MIDITSGTVPLTLPSTDTESSGTAIVKPTDFTASWLPALSTERYSTV